MKTCKHLSLHERRRNERHRNFAVAAAVVVVVVVILATLPYLISGLLADKEFSVLFSSTAILLSNAFMVYGVCELLLMLVLTCVVVYASVVLYPRATCLTFWF